MIMDICIASSHSLSPNLHWIFPSASSESRRTTGSYQIALLFLACWHPRGACCKLWHILDKKSIFGANLGYNATSSLVFNKAKPLQTTHSLLMLQGHYCQHCDWSPLPFVMLAFGFCLHQIVQPIESILSLLESHWSQEISILCAVMLWLNE